MDKEGGVKREPESRENRFAENMKEEVRFWERARERQRQRLQGHVVQDRQSSQGCPVPVEPQLTLTLLLLRYRV